MKAREQFYHINIGDTPIGRYVLLPGDPARVEIIAGFLDDCKEVARNREFTTYVGRLEDEIVTVCSTGIGSPSAIIAMEELAQAGATTFLRVGTCGPIEPHVKMGDMVIATASVRLEGTSRQYVMIEYPASAAPIMVSALAYAADNAKVSWHAGISASTDAFYVGQSKSGNDAYLPSSTKNLLSNLQQARVLCFEMESSAIFSIANLYGLRAGATFVAVPTVIGDRHRLERERRLAHVGIEAIRIMIHWDRERKKNGLPPSIVAIPGRMNRSKP